MSISSRRPLMERLEDRRLATVNAGTYSVVAGTASVDAYRGLQVYGTGSDDYISVRGVTGGRTQVEITSTFDLPGVGATVNVRGNKAATLTATPSGDGSVTHYTLASPVAFASDAYDTINVSGKTGIDTLREQRLHSNAAGDSIEHVILVQTTAPAGQTASDPADGIYNQSAAAWKVKLTQQLAEAKTSTSPLAFFGDSHAERYLYYGIHSWRNAFAGSLNLGTSGDNTRQLLARIKAGLFDTYKPKMMVLMVGTNNLIDPAAGGTDDQVMAGIHTLMRTLHGKLPATKFIFVSLFPRREVGMNDRIAAVNARIADRQSVDGYHFLDVYHLFLGTRGYAVRNYFYNADSHLSAAGYRELTPPLVHLIKTIDV